ncbi:PH domain-containing protein [Streptomyces hesseae]|uniref:PH domain-containing protein n=1 Tax=Streptomyces hesseae TaxID=3075519 RepID=A0ABU2SQV7_9ACTN|nr:PH domain-containing protein [Streptomyces sp. DSM 40473]MDT0450380.1 PH domain-containing protein [Streptomyces sp. DSM 40473]
MSSGEGLRLRAPRHGVDPGARGWWTARALLTVSGPMTLAALALLVPGLLFFSGALVWLAPLVTVVLLVPAVAYALVMPARRCRTHGWELGETALYAVSGWFGRRRRIVPLSRVESVALRRGPLLRRYGLAVVTVATGSDAGAVRIAGVSDTAARRLTARIEAAIAHREPAVSHAEEGRGAKVLAVASARRLRYAPLTFWVWGGVLVAGGTVWRVLNALGVKPWRIGIFRRLWAGYGAGAPWLAALLGLAAVTLLGVAGALVVHAGTWWRYRLERTPSGGLDVRRGLFATSVVSIEADRLCGVALREPLLLRAGGGASVRAVAGGLGDRERNRKRSVVLPPAPRAEALRVCAEVLGVRAEVLGTGGVIEAGDAPRTGELSGALRPAPRVALRRRLVGALGWGVLPVALVLVGLGWLLDLPVLLWCAAGWVAVASPVVCALAWDAYRALGYAVRGRHLVVRSGTFGRETVALDRSSVQGWTFTDTPFALRADVATLTAAVPAGEDGYRIRDIPAAEAAKFAEFAAPGIVREFLIRTSD